MSKTIADDVALHVRSTSNPSHTFQNLDDWNLSEVASNNVAKEHPRLLVCRDWVSVLAWNSLVNAHKNVAVIGCNSVKQLELEIDVLFVLSGEVLSVANLREAPDVATEGLGIICLGLFGRIVSLSCDLLFCWRFLNQNLASSVQLLPVGTSSVQFWLLLKAFVGVGVRGNALPSIIHTGSCCHLEVNVFRVNGVVLEFSVKFAYDNHVDGGENFGRGSFEWFVIPDEVPLIRSVELAETSA